MRADFQDYEPGRFGMGADEAFARELWAFLNEEAQVTAMKLASDLGHPAVVGVADALVARFGDKLEDDRRRQLVGHMARQIMERENYELDQADVKVTAYPFTKATRYKRKGGLMWFVFRASGDVRELCITEDRGEIVNAPAPKSGKKWNFWTTITTTMQAAIGLGVSDSAKVRAAIKRDGYCLRAKPRVLRKA